MAKTDMDTIRTNLALVNDHRGAKGLGPLQPVNGIDPKGIIFLAVSTKGMNAAHEGGLKRAEAIAFLAGQLDALSTQG